MKLYPYIIVCKIKIVMTFWDLVKLYRMSDYIRTSKDDNPVWVSLGGSTKLF